MSRLTLVPPYALLAHINGRRAFFTGIQIRHSATYAGERADAAASCWLIDANPEQKVSDRLSSLGYLYWQGLAIFRFPEQNLAILTGRIIACAGIFGWSIIALPDM
jgi:hypothetical protein